MKRLIAIFAFFLIGTAYAQTGRPDHLVPIDNVYTAPWIYDFEAYDADVIDVLEEVYDLGVFARMIVVPSFRNEYAVAIAAKDDAYAVIGLRSSHHIWLFTLLGEAETAVEDAGDNVDPKDVEELAELRAALPESLDDVTVEKCSIAMNAEAADKLNEIWAEMLFRTRYEDRRPVTLEGPDEIDIRFDGSTFNFGIDYGGAYLTGKTWSPDETSMPGRFVAVAETLNRACWAQDESLIEEAVAGAEAMLGELAGSRY